MASPDSLQNISIEDLIPQRKPIIMVDKLLKIDEESAISSFLPKKDNIFVENQHFSGSGLIENMAQTAAAHAGYWAQKQNTKASVGFIGGIKNFEMYFSPDSQKEIITEIKIDMKVMGASVISASVKQEDKLAATCQMKIFLPGKNNAET